MTQDQVEQILKTIKFIIINKKALKKRYIYNKDTNMFHYDQNYVVSN